jgi:nucleotide-binding universal stress UspA family protein
MPIKKILVPVRGDDKGEGVLDHALALAGRCNAHIDVVHARAPASEFLSQSVMVTQSMRQSVRELAEREADDQERRVRKLFEDYCQAHDLKLASSPAEAPGQVTVSWQERRGSQASVVGLWGRLADVVAVAQPSRDRTLGHNTLEAALFQAGKLVLVCPVGLWMDETPVTDLPDE